VLRAGTSAETQGGLSTLRQKEDGVEVTAEGMAEAVEGVMVEAITGWRARRVGTSTCTLKNAFPTTGTAAEFSTSQLLR